MEQLDYIEGLVNLELLKELGVNITCIAEDLWEEGFEAEDIIEYLNKVIADQIVNTIYKLQSTQSI